VIIQRNCVSTETFDEQLLICSAVNLAIFSKSTAGFFLTVYHDVRIDVLVPADGCVYLCMLSAGI